MILVAQEEKELNDKMQRRINKSIQIVKDWMSCRDKGCVCMEDDYDIIQYNMSLGWSLEISEALLGEHKYMNINNCMGDDQDER